jgi:hypothetical protein
MLKKCLTMYEEEKRIIKERIEKLKQDPDFKLKYPAYDSTDITSDDLNIKEGKLVNREFFTSNVKGSFYEGLKWDSVNKEWI